MLIKSTLGALSLISGIAAQAAPPVDIATFIGLPRPAPSTEVRYGPAPTQVIDVFMPVGPGPHPVAMFIHGGCWSVNTAGREQLRHIGAELAGRGIAVWNIGYRRANEAGGGYPGMYQDIGSAVDLLRTGASDYNFDLTRTVLVGHSAGGHLALWAAAREGLPSGSPLSTPKPFVPPAIISLAGIGDIKASAASICGPNIAERLKPPSAADATVNLYADVSPIELPAPGARVVMISAVLDRLVPPFVAFDYVQAMHKKGKSEIELTHLPNAGHFDLVTTGTTAWSEVLRLIEGAVARR
jgi:acetyl esterase/lipase